ncbi:MAG: hypothetical protein MUF34_12990 [Polyangiaceae bacterium]|nr:hypothetical protein [Polyangiaceae bacterium]
MPLSHDAPRVAQPDALALIAMPTPEPVGRRPGGRAEFAWRRARMAEAMGQGEGEVKARALGEMARWLGSRWVDLGSAIGHAQRALSVGEDAELERLLVGWLAPAGRLREAAEVSRAIASAATASEGARFWSEAALLAARAGDGVGAAEDLRQAVAADAGPLPAHRLAALGAWAPEAVTGEEAADHFLLAANRRAARGDKVAALEEHLRAFEACPGHYNAGAALHALLASKGRWAAALGVWRAFAEAAGGEAARGPVRRAVRQVLAQGAEPAALSEALALSLELSFDEAMGAAGRSYIGDLSSRLELPSEAVERAASASLEARAPGFVRLSTDAPAPAKAALLAAAARLLAKQGRRAEARDLARRALDADPTLGSAFETFLEVFDEGEGRQAVTFLERAAGVLLPRARLYERLAACWQRIGDLHWAAAWSKRWVSLRPADPEALSAWLERCAQAEGGRRLAEALEHVLAMPVPFAPLRTGLEEALRRAGLDAGSGGPLLWRALRSGVLAEGADLGPALRDVARERGDSELEAAVLESWTARGGEAMAPPTLELAEAQRRRDERVGERLALQLALAQGTPWAEIASRLGRSADDGADPDEALLGLELVAAAAASGQTPADGEAVRALRELGALRWDRADDRAGALEAWVEAARLDPTAGWAALAADVVSFAGEGVGHEVLSELTSRGVSPRDAARALAAAALAALRAGGLFDAAQLAESSLALDPARVDALAVLEASLGDSEAEAERLETAYSRLAASAKGSFGRRASHYRAARQLEQRGLVALALTHALAAFEAVPSVGAAFALARRLVEEAGGYREGLATFARTAAAASDPADRARWLRQAASWSTSAGFGPVERAELWERILLEDATPDAFEAWGRALGELVRDGESVAARERFAAASERILAQSEGPTRARLALSFASVALVHLAAPGLAVAMVVRALRTDAFLDEYDALTPHAAALAGAERVGPEGVVGGCLGLLGGSFMRVGPAALRLGIDVARAAGDDEARARLVRALDPDEDGPPSGEATVVGTVAGFGGFAPGESEEGGASLEVEIDAGAALEFDIELEHESPRSEVMRSEPPRREATPGGLPRGEASPGEPARHEAPPSEPLRRELPRSEPPRRELPRSEPPRRDVARSEPPRSVVPRSVAPRSEPPTPPRLPVARPLLLPDVETTVELDDAALGALELQVAEHHEHELLADVLARRIVSGASAEEVRVLRLRRAALLEQRLSRLDEAKAELEALLVAHPSDVSATRFLADLYDRTGEPARAGALWWRAFQTSSDPYDRRELAMRAADALARGGDVPSARVLLGEASSLGPDERTLALRVELERRAGGGRSLADALDELAVASAEGPRVRARLLADAARASLDAGERGAALERAQRAARVGPELPDVQLLARLLEYRARGAGTPHEAAQTVEALRPLADALAPEQVPLHAFLLAEALDVVVGAGAGLRELTARHAEVGSAPLIALGMAERLVRSSNYAAALGLFDVALAGDTLGLRRQGALALSAADAALRVDDLERAERYLSDAARDPSFASLARQRLDDLRASRRQREASLGPKERHDLEQAIGRAVGADRARALAKLARLVGVAPGERTEADRLLTEAIANASPDAVLRMELEAERDLLRGVPRPSSGNFEAAPRLEPIGEAEVETALPDPFPRPSELPAEPPLERARLAVERDPTDRAALTALRDAARGAGEGALERAAEHVLAAFTPNALPLRPPPFEGQRSDPRLALALALRGVRGPWPQAFAWVWQEAHHLFRRELSPSAGDDTGAESVEQGLVRSYRALGQFFGVEAGPLIRRPSAGPLTASLALHTPPAVVVSGDARPGAPEDTFRLAAALVSTSPPLALCAGLPAARLQSLAGALVAAFGAARGERAVPAAVASLAGSLWQSLGSPTRQRMLALGLEASDESLGDALNRARGAARRAGLLACGDVAVALREVIRDEGIASPLAVDSLEALASLARRHPSLLDLLRLALDADYAALRWSTPAEGSARAAAALAGPAGG